MEGRMRKQVGGAVVNSPSSSSSLSTTDAPPDAKAPRLGSLPPTPDTAVEVVHRERSPPAKEKEPMQLVTSELPSVQPGEPSAGASSPIRANPGTNDAMPLFKASDIEYDPAEPIGSGSFGQVFQGTLQRYKTVAIKVIPFATNEESRREKLLHEALIMMKSVSRGLSPFVIAFHGYVVEREFLKLLMEFADLGSLHKYIKDTSLAQQTVPVRTRVAFLHQVSLGMQFLHQQKIHHHDLKSENVLLTQASSSDIIAKISDFGLSRMVEGGLTRSTAFNRQGSWFWKAPERDVWKPLSSPKSDVFSFAVLLTEVILWSWEGVYGFTFDFLWSGGFEPRRCRDNDFRAVVVTNMDKTCFHANAYSPYGPQLRSIFERCWAALPDNRPDFEKVSQDLGILLGYKAATDNGPANTGSLNLEDLVSAGIRGAGAVQAEEEIQVGVDYRNRTSSPQPNHPAMSSGRQDEVRNLAADVAVSLQISADGGDPVSQKNLGLLYLNGRGVPKDPSMAAPWFRKAAEQGNAAAQNNLGLMYRNGNGVPKNLTETLRWFREAANQGDPDGLHNLGILYSDGEGVAQDLAEAAVWFRKAAEKGHAQSQANLGMLYKHGQGVQRDLAAAAHWFKKAADQGNADGLTHLGFLYRDGDGVPMDLHKAADLFQKAAENGDANAQSELHFLYLSGRGVPKDPAKAFYWAQKSAQQGSAAGQNNLGVLYHYGTGVEKNPSMAAHYFRKAIEQGHAGALDNLAMLVLSTKQQ